MIEYAWRELVRRKRRTFAHTAGYALAAAVIALVFTILLNGQAASDAILRGTGTHFAAFVPLCGNEACGQKPFDPAHEGFYVGSVPTKVLPRSVLEMARTLDSVADAAPFILFRLHNAGNPVMDFTLGGVPVDDSKAVATNSCSAQDLASGRFLSASDKGAAVIELTFAESRRLAVGSVLRLADRDYRVVGVVDTGIRVAKADVYLPIEEAQTVVNARLRYPIITETGLVLVESKSALLHETAVAQVKRLLGPNGSISSYNCFKPASQAMGVTDASASLIALIVFACLLAFSLQAQFSRVAERRYDIGILRSIGWSRAAVTREIVLEALIQALAGWAAGSLLALVVFLLIPAGALTGALVSAAKTLYPAVFALSLFLAAAGGVIAGFLPGFLAAAAKPAVCLRRL